MADLQFRVADPTDAGAILALKRVAIRELVGADYTDRQRAAWAPDDDALPAFETALRSDRFTVLLAERDGTIVGYGVLNGPAARIDAVYVHPEYARDGIATSLVRQLEMRARMRGIRELTIVASLTARPFYESLGYWKFDTTTRSVDGVDIEFIVLHKRLDSNLPG
jgi:GNAT superfamily N-acetyltransferase